MQKEKAPIGLYFLLIAVMASWGFNVTMTKVLVSYFPTVTMTSFSDFHRSYNRYYHFIYHKKITTSDEAGIWFNFTREYF